jgi:hypothetical protein
VYTRFRDWVKADVWRRLFNVASDEPDMEYAMVDAMIVKVPATGRAQKANSKSGDRPLQGRHDHQNPGPDRRLAAVKGDRTVAQLAEQRTFACCVIGRSFHGDHRFALSNPALVSYPSKNRSPASVRRS